MAPPSRYSPEFREEAVQIALRSSKTISEVARELELNSETLRGWVKTLQSLRLPGSGWPTATTSRVSASMTTWWLVEYR
ncbi:transposase [Streptomyces sp. NPDC059629]|uniref:transposase n=1 Tax=Streptomyces sp. NPDC059629 TaxID=3346889 RepID=UPI0036C8D771